VSSMRELTDDLLREAAVFVARDEGTRGFLDRFSEAMDHGAEIVSLALDRALAARARAGNAALELRPGDLRVQVTSSGATLTACAVAGDDGNLVATVRLIDAERHPVAGAALWLETECARELAVTDEGGWARTSGIGTRILVQVGGTAAGSDRPRGQEIIMLPRARRDGLELAAAHAEGHAADALGRWLITAGGVTFGCQDRAGGYDLTVTVTGVTSELAIASGAYGVRFSTFGRDGVRHEWIVPLAPSPLGLAGSLYGTDADRLDKGSVTVHGARELLAQIDDRLDDVVGRSVRLAERSDAWRGLAGRLSPGRQRSAVERAIADRENAL